MTGGLSVQYVTQEIDVALYGRKCSKLNRNKLRENDRELKVDRDLVDALKFKSAFPGTKFCTSGTSNYNARLEYDDLTPTDKCCK